MVCSAYKWYCPVNRILVVGSDVRGRQECGRYLRCTIGRTAQLYSERAYSIFAALSWYGNTGRTITVSYVDRPSFDVVKTSWTSRWIITRINWNGVLCKVPYLWTYSSASSSDLGATPSSMSTLSSSSDMIQLLSYHHIRLRKARCLSHVAQTTESTSLRNAIDTLLAVASAIGTSNLPGAKHWSRVVNAPRTTTVVRDV